MGLTIGKQNKMVAVLILDNWKTELQSVLYSNVFGIQAPIVTCTSRHPRYKTDLCRTYHTNGFCPYGPRYST